MSTASDESHDNNPLEALYSLSRRPAERSEPPRLASIGDAPLFPRAPKVEFKPEPLRPLTSPGDRLESAMSELVRRQIKPATVPEPIDFKPEAKRRTIGGLIGVVTAVAVACFAALLFVTLFPREKDIVRSFAAAAPPAPQSSPDPSNGALSQFRAAMAGDRDQNLTHEQSERLLQQFVQWRQKAALTDKP